ncbi:MAG: hypothetical protein ACXQS3_05250 [Candidatus Methanofastidiosia archaeon]
MKGIDTMKPQRCPYIKTRPNGFFMGDEEYCSITGTRLSNIHINKVRTLCHKNFLLCQHYAKMLKKDIVSELQK